MSRTETRAAVFLAVGVALSMAGCAGAPELELSEAKAAIEAARAAGAESYAPNEMEQATRSLAAAEAEIAAQNGKFGPLRNYGKAKDQIAAARRLAEAAQAAVVSGKEAARAEAADLHAKIGDRLESTRALLNTVPGDGRGRSIKLAIGGDLDEIERSLPTIAMGLENGDYDDAREIAWSSYNRLESLARELEDAIDRRVGGK